MVVSIIREDKAIQMSYRVTDIEYLREYLKYATMFEKNLYIWSQALDEVNRLKSSIYNNKKMLLEKSNKTKSIYSSRSSNEVISKYINEERQYRKISKIAQAIFIVEICIAVSVAVITYVQKYGMGLTADNLLLLLLRALLGLLAGVCNLVGIGSVIIWRKFKSKADFSKKEAERFARTGPSNLIETEIERYQSQMSEYTLQEKKLTERQNEICRALNTARDNLNRLYSENILPEKYRSFNAVATMYEYLETGRCNTIQGHGGIYDTYVKDLQMGLIIQNLESIKASISRIEDNQQFLYNELRQANSTLQTINSSLADIRTTSAQIARNTAISAEANRQTAAAAQWFTWRAWARGF